MGKQWKLNEKVKPFSGGAKTRWIDSGVVNDGLKETIILFNSDLETARRVAAFEEMYEALKAAEDVIESLWQSYGGVGSFDMVLGPASKEKYCKIESALKLADSGSATAES